MQFYKQKRKGFGFWIFWILGVVLATLHFLTLNLAPAYSYDHVRNMQIILQLAQGDFSSVFHHISPLFYLFFGFLYWCGLGFEELRMINLLLGLACIGLIAAWWARRSLPLWAACAAMLLISLSVVFSYNLRIFSIEAASIGFVGLIACALSVFKPIRACIAAGFGFLYNYKILLVFFPLIFVWIILNRKKLHLKLGLQSIIGFLAPILLFWIASIIIGLPIFQYPKKIWAIAFLKNVNPENQSSGFQFDFLYYFKYLWHFEKQLGCFILLMLVFLIIKLAFRNHIIISKNSRYWILCACIYICMVMCLQKAPRALLPFLPLLIFPIMEFVSNYGRRMLIFAGLIPIFVFQFRNSWSNSIHLDLDNYPRLAHFIDNNQIDTVYTMASLGIWPAAYPKKIQIVACLQTQCFPKTGVWYLIDDGYSQAAGLKFALPAHKELLLDYPNPITTLPILFFEHSEFANESFAETFNRFKNKKEHSGRIRLYKIRSY